MGHAKYALSVVCLIAALAGMIQAKSLPTEEDLAYVPPKEGVDYFNVKVGPAIEAAEGWTKGHPQDAAGFFVLGRLHAMACMFGDAVPLAEPLKAGVLPRFGAPRGVLLWRTIKADASREAALNREHIPEAIKAFSTAANIAPEVPEYHFGLAAMLMEAAGAGGEIDNVPHGARMSKPEEQLQFEEALKEMGADSAGIRERGTKALMAGMPANFDALSKFKTDDVEVSARIRNAVHTFCETEALKEYRLAYKITRETDLLTKEFKDREPLSFWAAIWMQVIVKNHPDAADAKEQQRWAETIEKLEPVPGVRPRL